MGNIHSQRYPPELRVHNITNRSIDTISKLERICDSISVPIEQHCLRILVGPTTNITSKNPHILLKIAKWHKSQTDGIVFDFHALLSNNNPNEFIFKMSLTNKHIENIFTWKTEIIAYINSTTSYHLNCVTNSLNPNGNGDMYFISWYWK